jgi:hypothetical protein
MLKAEAAIEDWIADRRLNGHRFTRIIDWLVGRQTGDRQISFAPDGDVKGAAVIAFIGLNHRIAVIS